MRSFADICASFPLQEKSPVGQTGASLDVGASATVGIATPGALSAQTGLLRNSNSVVLNGKPLDRDIANALGLSGSARKRCELSCYF